ncbi:MAG: hypothetical protein ACREP6_12185 [Candidatus Binataceae bacterium]
MRTSELGLFFQSLGHRVVQTRNSFWYRTHDFLYKPVVDHIFDPSTDELMKVLMTGPALAVRYSGFPGHDSPDGALYICSDTDYGLSSLSANARSHTRRGLRRCAVEELDFRYLARHGHALTQETNLRQTGKFSSTTQEQWERYCRLASSTEGFEAWGAFVDLRLAAFVVAILVEGCFYIHLQKSCTELHKHYPNNALLFTVVKSAIIRPEVDYILHSGTPLTINEGLHHFKLSMGFRLRPYKEQIIFNPLVRPIINRPVSMMVDRLARRYPRNPFWRQASRALHIGREAQPGFAQPLAPAESFRFP